MKPFIAYARYSKDVQKETSVEGQFLMCEEYAAKNGYPLTPRSLFEADPEVHGYQSFFSRSGAKRLLDKLESGQFGGIIADELSRVSRNHEIENIIAWLHRRDMRLVAVLEHYDSTQDRLGVQRKFKSFANEQEIEDKKHRSRRGGLMAVRQGYSAGGRIYGYYTEPEYQRDASGRPVRKLGHRFFIHQEEAEIVRRIFKMYSEGYSMRDIVEALNSGGVKPPRRDVWHHTVIRSILQNEKYKGVWRWNKIRREAMLDYNTQLHRCEKIRKEIPLDPESWVNYPKEVSENLKVVDEVLWDQVNAMLKRNKERYGAVEGKDGRLHCARPGVNSELYSEYLFSGLLFHECCGGKIIVVDRYTYGCTNYKNYRTCDENIRVNIKRLETVLVDHLVNNILVPERVEYIIEEVNRRLSERLSQYNGKKEKLLAEKAQVENQIRNLVEAIKNGLGSRLAIAEVGNLEQERLRLETEMAEVASTGKLLIPRPVIEEKLKDVRSLLLVHPRRGHLAISNIVKSLYLGKDQTGIYAYGEGDAGGLLDLWNCKLSVTSPTGNATSPFESDTGLIRVA